MQFKSNNLLENSNFDYDFKNKMLDNDLIDFIKKCDAIVKKSDEMIIAYDDWVTGGKVGASPRPPMFASNPGEARKYFGGGGDDWKMIGK